MKKHAYLIMAHNNFKTLEKLIEMIDYELNDIYIHVDKKVSSFNQEYFMQIPRKSQIYFIERMEVNWGGVSQVICELNLLEKAIPNQYSYYHLLSGVDLPIKSQEYIHNFFEQNEGKEFVGFTKNWNKDRVKYYYLFNETGRKRDIYSKVKKITNKLFIQVQKSIGYVRYKKFNFAKGANWFSITHDLAKYTVSKKEEMIKLYKNSIFCDELFLQTLIINSNFKHHLYKGIFDNEYDNNMRYIDWDRGNPHVFKKEDFNSIIHSNKLFARKFDENEDMEIINMIYEEVLCCK